MELSCDRVGVALATLSIWKLSANHGKGIDLAPSWKVNFWSPLEDNHMQSKWLVPDPRTSACLLSGPISSWSKPTHQCNGTSSDIQPHLKALGTAAIFVSKSSPRLLSNKFTKVEKYSHLWVRMRGFVMFCQDAIRFVLCLARPSADTPRVVFVWRNPWKTVVCLSMVGPSHCHQALDNPSFSSMHFFAATACKSCGWHFWCFLERFEASLMSLNASSFAKLEVGNLDGSQSFKQIWSRSKSPRPLGETVFGLKGSGNHWTAVLLLPFLHDIADHFGSQCHWFIANQVYCTIKQISNTSLFIVTAWYYLFDVYHIQYSEYRKYNIVIYIFML